MRPNRLHLTTALALLVPGLGLLLGVPIRTLFPLWVATLVLVVMLHFAMWFRERCWSERGGAFRNLVYVTLALMAALPIVALWLYSPHREWGT